MLCRVLLANTGPCVLELEGALVSCLLPVMEGKIAVTMVALPGVSI